MPGGRPKATDNWTEHHWKLLEALAGLPPFITNVDVARYMQTQPHCATICYSTLQRIIKKKYGCSFDQFRDQNAGVIRAKLLLKQFEVALKGNIGMLIWLGKNYLNQSDDPIVPVGPESYTPPIGDPLESPPAPPEAT